jgi:hypothetical protein|uniref:DUF1134 domain-containing protein n=1 Tax=Desulfobacca acetoxidans TaxID=60893 RepID=A0A7C3UX60_9BACT
MRKKLLVVALVLALVLTAGAALAETPSGTISIELNSASALMGASWGQAVLTYGGKTHLFKVRGLKVLAVGLTKLSVGGDVYNLKNLADMSGTYQKADPAGLTFIVGETGLVVQNGKGVTINFKGLRKGLGLDLVKEGLIIESAK